MTGDRPKEDFLIKCTFLRKERGLKQEQLSKLSEDSLDTLFDFAQDKAQDANELYRIVLEDQTRTEEAARAQQAAEAARLAELAQHRGHIRSAARWTIVS